MQLLNTMVFSQHRIFQRSFQQHFLLHSKQFFDTFSLPFPHSKFGQSHLKNSSQIISYHLFKWFFFKPRESAIILTKQNPFKTKDCKVNFLFKQRDSNWKKSPFEVRESFRLNSFCDQNFIRPNLEVNQDDDRDDNTNQNHYKLNELVCRKQYSKYNLLCASEELLKMNKFNVHALINRYGYKDLSFRIKANKTFQIHYYGYCTRVEPKDDQTNVQGNKDEDAKKGIEKSRDITRAKKPSSDDAIQAAAQLESLKAQVKKIHEEMQVRKLESWPQKISKLASNIGHILYKIGPTTKRLLSMNKEDWNTKIGGWKRIIKLELQHYWIGGKLLWADLKISARLLYRLAGGRKLSRRERAQLKRTIADIFRLVPFMVIVIVPFMELLLPFLLKIFPTMLPSTFRDKNKEQENANTKLVAQVQYAKFLKETVQEMAQELKKSPSEELRRNASELESFMNKVHKGGDVSNKEIIAFAKLFKDELTLDNISRPRLLSMCKYINIQPYGTNAYLRFSLRNKLLEIKKDDEAIEKEGIDSLSEAELRLACRDRGMLGIQSIDNMHTQAAAGLAGVVSHS
nr:uncharacterized protein LOC112276183 isoform X3 [Physcomitrium patens]|eukprot:XP_024363051.1 uncharacterized protein LOC112276183 isoform X3 [Physcomitrella patens]